MPGYHVDDAAMNQAKAGFTECATNAKNAMNSLQNSLEGLLSTSTYAGAQATAFQNLHTQIQADMKTASDKIDQLGELIGVANTRYQSSDQQAAQSMHSIASSMSDNGLLNRLGGLA